MLPAKSFFVAHRRLKKIDLPKNKVHAAEFLNLIN